MGYSLNKLKEELTVKGLADDGLVAWGNSGSGVLGGAFGGMQVIYKKGTTIFVTPFNNKEIVFSETTTIDKQSIVSAAVKGLLGKKLVIKMNDGKTLKFAITQGAGNVKAILQNLGI